MIEGARKVMIIVEVTLSETRLSYFKDCRMLCVLEMCDARSFYLCSFR